MNILVLDNYDSFTYNLVQYLEEIEGVQIEVRKNDQITLEAVAEYDAVVLSPGPGLPKDAGIMPELIQQYAPKIPILGVCLGLQAIGEAFGGSLLNLDTVYHGMATNITISSLDSPIFNSIPTTFQAGRYHSWVIDKMHLPNDLDITAVDENDVIMAMQHKTYPLCGVQFHPESILTPLGRIMLQNFIDFGRDFYRKKII